MTRAAFRDYVLSLVKYSGQPYVTDVVDVNTVINNRLRKFTEETRCLYSDNISFTLTPGTATYSLRDTAVFDREVIEAQYVLIDGSPLFDLQGQRGPVSVDELMTVFPGYLDIPNNKPARFAILPPHTIRLHPGPDIAYPNCYVAGWYFHPTINTSAASGDAVELSIPEEYHKTAAYFTAAELMLPTSDGQTDYDRLTILSKMAANEMETLRDRSKRQINHPLVRGWKKKSGFFSVGH